MITGALRANVVGTWGEAGRRWLGDLPGILSGFAGDWKLTIGTPYDLSLHFVVAATCDDGTPAVLKLGVPGGGSLADEAAALTAFDGRGAVRLLRADLDRGALLLERVEPGWRLRDLVPHNDTEATSALVGVMRQLHSEPATDGRGVRDLVDQADAFDRYVRRYGPDRRHGQTGPLPYELVVRAGGLMRELCASAQRRVVLHGDLHHDNILRAGRESWLAIDPHGVVGDPGYEIGAMLYNPEPAHRDPGLVALLDDRIEQVADELAMPIERGVAWGFVKAMLSEVWTAESPESQPPGCALDVARRLWRRLRD